MEHVILDDGTDLSLYTNPVTVLAFTGWNDAGGAASTALATLADAAHANPIATIDPEIFTDFASVRPTVRLDDDKHRVLEWPAVYIYGAKLPGTDVIFIIGPEPALRWRLFGEQIVEICRTVGSPLAISLGALLADVPHTRPTQVIGTSTDQAVTERFDLRESQYEGPTGILGVITQSLDHAGVATASLWAAVPEYASHMPSPPAAVALVERACQMMGTPPPTLELSDQIATYQQEVEAMLGDDNDLAIYIDRLEKIADEDDNLDTTPPSGIVEGDPEDLANEVEAFLREHDDT